MRRALLAVVVVAFAAPASASASVAGTSPLSDTIVYAADPGETNDVTVSFDGTNVVFDDPAAAISPQRNCTAVTEHRVTCALRQPYGSVAAQLADGNDRAKVVGGNKDQYVS